MIILVAPDRVTVHEPSEFAAFHVETALSPDDLDAALRRAGAGRTTGGEATIEVRFIREAVGRLAGDPDWVAGFGGMLRYARRNGWLTEQGDRIRAHVAPTGPIRPTEPSSDE